ncbi:MAG: MFS transporter [Proteobacteria bacterium]|nr:MFS transporter [Pseudomonadota bacterium]
MGGATPRHDSREAWLATVAALGILTIAHGGPMIATVALTSVTTELATTRGAVAAAVSLSYVGAAGGGIIAGWLAGRWGIRRVVLFGAVMLCAGLVLSVRGGLPWLYAGHGLFIGLLGTACMLSPLMTYVSFWFVKQRGAAVALIASGQSIAGALWPLLFEWGIALRGWRWTMEAYGAGALIVITLLTGLFLKPPPSAAAAGPQAVAAPLASLAGLRPQAAMAALMVAVFCCCVPMNMPMQHIVAFCGDIGLSSRRGAAMLSVLLGTAFLARQVWGLLADRIGGLRTLAWSSAVQGIALCGLLVTRNEAVLFSVSAVFGFGLSGLLPAYVIAIREYFPAREAAWRVPTVLFAGYVGMATGGWGAGALYDRFGDYLPAFLLGLAFNAVNLTLLLVLVVRDRRPPLETAAPARAGAAPA